MKKHHYNGKLLTVSELCALSPIGLSPQALRFRLARGWPMNRALSEPLATRGDSGRKGARKANQPRARKIALDGRIQTVAEVAQMAGISRQTASERIRRGWSPRDAISKPTRPISNNLKPKPNNQTMSATEPKMDNGREPAGSLRPKWLTLPNAAIYSSLSERFLEDLAKSGQVVSSHVIQKGKTRGRVLLSVESLDALILAGVDREPVKLAVNEKKADKRLVAEKADQAAQESKSQKEAHVPSEQSPELIDRAEAARRLSLSVRTLDELIASGDLSVVRIGRTVRIRPSTIVRFVESRETNGRRNNPNRKARP